MSFDLRAIAIFSAGSLFYGLLAPARLRSWIVLAASLLVVYWLQPPLLIRHSDYILPTTTIGLSVAGWWFTLPVAGDRRSRPTGQDWRALAVVLVVVLGVAAMRYTGQWRLTPSRPPSPPAVVTVVATLVLSAFLAGYLAKALFRRPLPAGLLALAVVALFIILKSEPLAATVSAGWRDVTGRDPALASAADLRWLGFSFVAFRLLHTLRDRRNGILPALSLRDYLTYALFFPAFTAGPIDRAERFAGDMAALPALDGRDGVRFLEGGGRIAAGLFKKFVLADSLARGLSLDAALAAGANSIPALWLLLYGYGVRLYLDFAGYSDIAIGIGRLFGFRLPENFRRPYLTENISAFWQSWHITLGDWARFYIFTPLSRWLLTRRRRLPVAVIVLLAQLATMTVIGLWHGLTANFLTWGIWHGMGLFGHKVWSDRTRRWHRRLGSRPRLMAAWRVAAWFLTFHYVTLGWVWFALPDLGLSGRTLLRLFGLGW